MKTWWRWLLRRRYAWKLILAEQDKIDRYGWSFIFGRGVVTDEHEAWLLRKMARHTRNTIRLRKYYDGKNPWYTPKFNG